MNRKQMIERLEQYKREDGTYRLAFVTSSNGLKSELAKLARQLNEELCRERQGEITRRGKTILAKKALTSEDRAFLFRHGNADNVEGLL